jgi:hypothetical protein
VAATKHPVTTAAGDGMKLTPKYTFSDAPQADIVVIPGGGYEAPSDSAAVAWIRRQQTYPNIKAVNDERVIDDGKIITTAGLSAGIDGALHVVAVMDGEDAARSVALGIEYDWQPNHPYVRGAMADRLVPSIDPSVIGEWIAGRRKGDKDHWERATWFKSKLSAPELFSVAQTAYEKAYAADGLWSPGSFRMASTGPLNAGLSFDDQDGHHWQGALTVEPTEDTHQFLVRLVTARAN